jgi:hypothetical protein
MAEDRSEINELQKEWRREVGENLKELRLQCSQIQNSLSDIKQNYATYADIERLDADISKHSANITILQNDKAKLIGFLVALQLIGGAVLGIILKYMK